MFNVHESSHDTLVIGWDATGNVKYCKSFNYMKGDKEAAQEAFKFVTENFAKWQIGAAELILHVDKFKPEPEDEK